jgi:hypothetical protein
MRKAKARERKRERERARERERERDGETDMKWKRCIRRRFVDFIKLCAIEKFAIQYHLQVKK